MTGAVRQHADRKATKSMRLFADEVMPALKALSPRPIEVVPA